MGVFGVIMLIVSMLDIITYVFPTIVDIKNKKSTCDVLGAIQVASEVSLFLYPGPMSIYTFLMIVKDKRVCRNCSTNNKLKLAWFVSTIVLLLLCPIIPGAFSYERMSFRGIRCWFVANEGEDNFTVQYLTYYNWALIGALLVVCFGLRILIYVLEVRRSLFRTNKNNNIIESGLLISWNGIDDIGRGGINNNGNYILYQYAISSKQEKELLQNFIVLLCSTLIAVFVAVMNEFILKGVGHERLYGGWNEFAFIFAFTISTSIFNRKYFTSKTFNKLKKW